MTYYRVAPEDMPKFCPYCGRSDGIHLFVSEALPESETPVDPQSDVYLTEHQCSHCDGRSFWT